MIVFVVGRGGEGLNCGSVHSLCAFLQAIVEAASLNEDGRRRKIVITGCLAQRYSDELAADLPEADLVSRYILVTFGSLVPLCVCF